MNASSIEVFILLFLVIPPKLLKVPAMHRLLYKQTNKKLSLAPFSFCLIVNFFFVSNKRLQCCDSPRHSSWQLLMKTDISCLNHEDDISLFPISSISRLFIQSVPNPASYHVCKQIHLLVSFRTTT